MSLKRRPPEGNVRRVRSTGQNSRGVITNKAGRLVQFESFNERKLYLRLDFDRRVKDYCSQPETFSYVDDDGKIHHYTPDAKVWFIDGSIEIHEVTLSKRQQRKDLRRRARAAEQLCRERGWRYVVHTEQTLPQATEVANFLALIRFRPTVFENQEILELLPTFIPPTQTIRLRGLAQQIAATLKLPEADVVASLCHYIWHGQLVTDLAQLIFDDGQIMRDTLVWSNSNLENE